MNLKANNRIADAPPGSLNLIVVPIQRPSSISRIQGESVEQTKPLTKNIYRAQSAAAGLSLEGGALTHALKNTGNGDGHSIRIRNPEHRAKAERFWENLSAKRKQPGNCCRCGKPHDGEYRQCDKCRVRVAALKAKRQVKQMTMAECVAMVKRCRREVSKLREIIKQMKRHYEYRRNKNWQTQRTLRKYADAYSQISKQEASTLSHAYDANLYPPLAGTNWRTAQSRTCRQRIPLHGEARRRRNADDNNRLGLRAGLVSGDWRRRTPRMARGVRDWAQR